MQYEAVIDGVSIVFVGSFNPKIFHPGWFAAQGLIRPEEAEAADITVVHSELVAIQMEWARVEVTTNRALFATTDFVSAEPLRDLALGTFLTLSHTPISKMGLNRDRHFKMANQDAWNAIGDSLAPKGHWRSILNCPGMRSLTMEGVREDGHAGYVRVKVEPSARVEHGVFVALNDHYELKNPDEPGTCELIMNLLKDSWASFSSRSETVGPSLLESALGGGDGD